MCLLDSLTREACVSHGHASLSISRPGLCQVTGDTSGTWDKHVTSGAAGGDKVTTTSLPCLRLSLSLGQFLSS